MADPHRSHIAPRRALSSEVLPWLAGLFVVLLFFGTLGQGGIWDPFELGVADLSRRIAIHVFRGTSLELPGSDNSFPHLIDLGRGELPFDSIGLGFRLFGLHEWAGRLPLALWALAGVAALVVFLARLVDRKAALYGALVLSTMPLYFIQARTMLGDIVTMASISLAFSGLGLAAFDSVSEDTREKGSRTPRVVALTIGLLGCVFGFMSRGALIGVAIPALSIGITWGILRSSDSFAGDRFSDAVGGASLLLGFAATLLGIRALSAATPTEYSALLGAQVLASTPKFPTYDTVIHYLGHSLFPWSAFIPFAIGRLFREPPAADGPAALGAQRKESAARAALLVGSCLAYGVYSLLAPRTGYLAFGAPALLAGITAIAIRDFERGAPPSRAVAVGVALLTLLFLRDYIMFPEKGLSVFAVNTTTFPESFKDKANRVVLLSSFSFIFLVFFSWLERDRGAERPFQRDDYLAWPRALSRAWKGNLAYGLAILEVALVGIGISVYVGVRFFHAKQIIQLGEPIRLAAVNAFWMAPVALFFIVWGTLAVRDAFRFFFLKTGVSRGLITVLAGVVVGSLLSFVYYPALAAQLSPKEVFDAYSRLHQGNEPLALLGVGGKSASYYSGGETKVLPDVQSAYTWLTTGTGRRWMVVRNEDLPRLNSLYRARPQSKQNLPVLDARSSQIMLVSNELASSEKNQSPFEGIVLNAEPAPENRVAANLQDQLQVLGWDVWDSAGQTRVEGVVPARKYHFRIYFKVIGPMSADWETFIHIDGFHRRFNGDHKTAGGKYAFNLWQPGDYIVDDYVFSLEPNFTPGAYNVYLGLFTGETRMKVKSGRHDDNRLEAGTLRVQ